MGAKDLSNVIGDPEECLNVICIPLCFTEIKASISKSYAMNYYMNHEIINNSKYLC